MNIFNIDFNHETVSLKNLIEFAETKAVTPHILKEYLVTSLLEDENVLSRVCDKTERIGRSLKSAALEDLHCLLKEMAHISFQDYIPTLGQKMPFSEYQQSLGWIVSSISPEEMLDAIIFHYIAFGAGKNAKYIAFRWQDGLHGVERPDDIRLEQLFCLDHQKKVLMENTSLFLQGLPANNALLYGDSGSGKSSMIKAMLNQYYDKGLRLVEMPKTALEELPQLIDCVKNKRLKYIIFMDDLSFEANETGYKSLKVILDGQIERQPENVLLYATSNRLHLINESWKDRQSDEVHFRDTMNEKLSLSERFGIRVNFASPDQEEYLEMIGGMLAKENISLSEEIKAEAIQWELSYHGRSGRTATQFSKMITSRFSLNRT